MAKQAKQLRKLISGFDEITTRMENVEDAQRDRDLFLVACMNVIRGEGLEDKLFDLDRPADLESEIFDVHSFTEAARKEMEKSNRNAPEKKEAKKEWCKRLVEIRTECDIPADLLYAHRLDGSVKRPDKNWRTLEKVADTTITDDCVPQELPFVGTIYVYAKRLRLHILDKMQDATLAGTKGVVPLFESRAEDLLTMLVEMKPALGAARSKW